MSIETAAEVALFTIVTNGSETLTCIRIIFCKVGRVIFEATFSTNSYALSPAEITMELLIYAERT